jgi:hypothetical protein
MRNQEEQPLEEAKRLEKRSAEEAQLLAQEQERKKPILQENRRFKKPRNKREPSDQRSGPLKKSGNWLEIRQEGKPI